MKTPILIIAAMSAALLGCAFGEEPSPSPPIDACNYSSWNPEAYCFYGEKAKIVDKLSNLSTATKLSERRVYLQITQGESSGDVKLYERQKNGNFYGNGMDDSRYLSSPYRVRQGDYCQQGRELRGRADQKPSRQRVKTRQSLRRSRSSGKLQGCFCSFR